MFFEFFENLRSKPKEARKRYALLFSIVCTVCIIILWSISIFINSYGARGTEQEKNKEINEPETTTALFEKANSFLGDTQGAGELVEPDWTKELETFDENTQVPPQTTASSTNISSSTSTTTQAESSPLTAPVSEFEY